MLAGVDHPGFTQGRPGLDRAVVVLSSAAGGTPRPTTRLFPAPDLTLEASRPMAKRARGTTSRPGQRAPLARPAGAAPRPATLTAEEEARAAELEAKILADERVAEETTRRNRDRSRRPAAEPAVARGSLAVQGAQEYAYVARDVRRLTIVGGSLVVLLIALWAVVQAAGIGPF